MVSNASLLLALLPLALGAGAPRAKDPVQALRVWIQRQERGRTEFGIEQEEELRRLLGDLRVVELGAPGRVREVDLVLLDLAALGWMARPERRAAAAVGSRSGMASALGLARLDRKLSADRGGAMARWLAAEVLGRPADHDLGRRIAAVDVLHGRHLEPTMTALFTAARDGNPRLRETAQRALAGWDDAKVHLFFLDQMERKGIAPPIALGHFRSVRTTLGPQALDRLRDYVGRLYVSDDWRDAARARSLVEVLDVLRAAPILIESLAVWARRTEESRGSRRISHEIVRELQRISGRSIGAHPERWNLWWMAVQEGRVETVEASMKEGTAVTAATFFGLRPVTDRVVFVIDRSRSMQAAFGTGDHSRYEEAVQQMVECVESLGEDTRFGVTLFNHSGRRWRTRLVRATPGNLTTVRRWLDSKHPDGGTQLFEGVRTALEIDRGGRVDSERMEADTVIVLCDGATAEGRAWVAPWLERSNDAAQLVFHCVQIGRGGDGTLEALAKGSGGDFVHIDR